VQSWIIDINIFSGNRYAPIVYVKKGYIEKYQDLISQFSCESKSYFGDFNHIDHLFGNPFPISLHAL